ncbi:hypothetical protein LZ30DRAFT_768926 [Colletotrichum cereale]|nr:hypothetical protein LZ30DRAFT_768926 [Colletotrichum cereale]
MADIIGTVALVVPLVRALDVLGDIYEDQPRESGPVEYCKNSHSYESSIAIRANHNGSPSSQGELVEPPASSPDAILHMVVEQAPLKDDGSNPNRPMELPRAPPYTRRQKSIPGLQGVASQWQSDPEMSNEDGPGISCRLESYDFLTSEADRSRDVSNLRPWTVHPDNQSWPSRHCGHLIRHVKLSQGRSNHVEARILCEAFVSTISRRDSVDVPDWMPSHTDSAERFVTELRRLDGEYCGVQKPNNIRQVFMLQVYHAHLKAFAAFLEEFEASCTRPRMRIFNPQYSQLRAWTMKSIMTDSIIYRQLSSSVKDVTSTCESLLEIATAINGEPENQLLWITTDVRGCCREVTTRLAGMSDDLQHRLDLLNLSWNVDQSGNVKILTLLATVFLPLSLSAGILSMGTRFKDLGSLIYDFFGVVVLLGALVLVILLLFFLVALLRELETRQRSRTVYWRWRPAFQKIGALVFLMLGGLVLASFVVGMFSDISLGAKILGYGLATVTVVLPSCLVMLMMIRLAVIWKKELN